MPYSILLVEDDNEIANLVELYLQNEGYRVLKMNNANEAILAIGQEKIDLALLDIVLPDLDGFTICKKIREKYTYPLVVSKE